MYLTSTTIFCRVGGVVCSCVTQHQIWPCQVWRGELSTCPSSQRGSLLPCPLPQGQVERTEEELLPVASLLSFPSCVRLPVGGQHSLPLDRPSKEPVSPPP